ELIPRFRASRMNGRPVQIDISPINVGAKPKGCQCVRIGQDLAFVFETEVDTDQRALLDIVVPGPGELGAWRWFVRLTERHQVHRLLPDRGNARKSARVTVFRHMRNAKRLLEELGNIETHG